MNNKYKKQFNITIKGFKFNTLINGTIGVRVLESCRLNIKQLESIRRVFIRLTSRAGKFWPRVFINKIITKKSKGSRMGKGTGAINKGVIDVKMGQVIFELSYYDITIINDFIAAIKGKIPARIEFIFKEL